MKENSKTKIFSRKLYIDVLMPRSRKLQIESKISFITLSIDKITKNTIMSKLMI